MKPEMKPEMKPGPACKPWPGPGGRDRILQRGQVARKLNDWLSSNIFWLMIVCGIIGIVFRERAAKIVGLVPFFLATMMLGSAVNCTLSSFKETLRKPVYFVATALIFYLVMPGVGYAVGRLFYPGEPLLGIGHILLAILPSAITSGVWISLCAGELALGVALMTMTTFLSVGALPVILSLFTGRMGSFDATGLILTLVKAVAIPAALGIFLNERYGPRLDPARPHLGIAVKISIFTVMAVNAAANVPYLRNLKSTAVSIIVAVLVQALIAYALAYIVFKIGLKARDGQVVAGLFVNGMRNDGAGIAVALAYFPPLVAFPSAVSILLQQTLASLIASFILARQRARPHEFPTPKMLSS